MIETRFAACMLLVLIPTSVARAQERPLWTEPLQERVQAFDTTGVGSVIVQLKTSAFAIDAESGKRLWTRADVLEYELVRGTPFVVFVTPKGRSVADLASGRDLWSLNALALTAVKGLIHLPSAGTVLVYGTGPASPHTLVAARYETGEVLWQQVSLFSDPAVAPKAAKIQYRTYYLDTPSTIVLDPTEDGLLRLDLQTGRVLWRIAQPQLPSKGDRILLFPADDHILVAHGKQLFAVNHRDGALAWIRKQKLPSPVAQAALTSSGLLVRGAANVDRKGRVSWRPYLALLDARTGTTRWTTEGVKFNGRSEFFLEESRVVIGLSTGVAEYDLATGAVLRTHSMPEFDGGEHPCCLERDAEGRLRIWSSQNLRLFDAQGTPIYSVYLKAPGASFLAKLATVAVAAAATSASMAAAGPGGFYTVYSPGPGSALFTKYKATTTTDRFSYIFTEEPGTHPGRFALVRVDKNTGKDTGRLKFTDRSPTLRVEPLSGIVIVAGEDALHARTFPPAS
jgi:outer membrane protein assembly factor BamB